MLRSRAVAVAVAVLASCTTPTDVPPPARPQSVVLLVTPKMLPDFANPDSAVAAFYAHYHPLTSRAAETVIILAIGNSDHILQYRGAAHWGDRVEWARTTDYIPVSTRVLDYRMVDGMVRSFRARGVAAGMTVKVFDHIDSGGEFTPTNRFKYLAHPECTLNRWGMFDVRARLQADTAMYATAPAGIAEGTLCGEFLVDQTARYLDDFAFDGILFDNQLGTRGRWSPGDGPGFSLEEATAIDGFLRDSKEAFAGREIMWFDSYNPVPVERETFSFPSTGYGYFDYLIASGFCVIESSQRYPLNLESKLSIRNGPRILATLDYVDPWYSYDSKDDYPGCSRGLEDIAIARRHEIDGVMFFANDDRGQLVPRPLIEAFAARLFQGQ